MYLRFITKFINEYGEQETGIFNAFRFVRENPSSQDKDVSILFDINN